MRTTKKELEQELENLHAEISAKDEQIEGLQNELAQATLGQPDSEEERPTECRAGEAALNLEVAFLEQDLLEFATDLQELAQKLAYTYAQIAAALLHPDGIASSANAILRTTLGDLEGFVGDYTAGAYFLNNMIEYREDVAERPSPDADRFGFTEGDLFLDDDIFAGSE